MVISEDDQSNGRFSLTECPDHKQLLVQYVVCIPSSASYEEWLSDIMYTAYRQHHRLYVSSMDKPVQNQATENSLAISVLLWPVRQLNERSGTEKQIGM